MLRLNIEDPGNLKESREKIVQFALERFSADIVTIFSINPIHKRFVEQPVFAGNLSQDGIISLRRPRDGRLTLWIADTGPLFVKNLADEPGFESDFTQIEGIKSFAALPLFTKQNKKILAVLYVGFRHIKQFGEYDKILLQEFAEQASLVLQSTWLLRRYRTVAGIGQEINQKPDTVRSLFKKLYQRVGDILDLSYFMMAVHNPQNNKLDMYIVDKGKTYFKPDMSMTGACAWVIKNKRHHLINDLSKAENIPFEFVDIEGLDLEESDISSLIFVPLIFREHCLGVLSVQHVDACAFDAEDRYILSLLSNQVALALHNMRLFESLSGLNNTAQLLIQQLNSDLLLKDIVHWIRETTKADLVILFPYVQATGQFDLPPQTSGELFVPDYKRPRYIHPDSIARFVLSKNEPIFERDSTAFYTQLGRKRKTSFTNREKISSTAAVPLRVNDEIVGVLFVNFRQIQHFDETQKHLVQGLANYAAIAIKNSREFGTLSGQHIRSLELYQKIYRKISSTLNLQQILQELLHLAAERIPYDEASILLENPRTVELETKAAIGPNLEVSRSVKISLKGEKGITCWVYRNKIPARVDNVYSDEWRDIYLEITADIKSELDVPLMKDKEVIGVVSFESTKEAAYSQEHQNLLMALADGAVLAINNALNYEEQERISSELLAVQEVSQEIVSQLKVKGVLDTILEQALSRTNSTAGQIILCDDGRGDLYIGAQRGVSEERCHERLPKRSLMIRCVIESKEPLTIDIREPYWSKSYERMIPDTICALCVPLIEGDKVRGLINIESYDERLFTERDEYFLKQLAALTTIALQNAERYEKAEKAKERLAALQEIDKQIINQLGNPVLAMHAVLENAMKLTIAEAGDLHIHQGGAFDTTYFAKKDELNDKIVITHGDSDDSIERGIVAYVAKKRVSYRTTKDAQKDKHYAGEKHIHSEMAVPLIFCENELIGVLNLESQKQGAFSDEDIWLLELFARQAVIAIQNARNYENAQEEARRFRMLAEAGARLGKITGPEQIERAYDIVIDIFEKHTKGQVFIRRLDEETQELVLVRVGMQREAIPISRLKLTEGISGKAYQEKKTIVIPNIDEVRDTVASPIRKNKSTKSLVVSPIQYKDSYYGSFSLSHEKKNYFKQADIELIEGLANQLAITLNRLKIIVAQQEAEQRIKEAEAMDMIGPLAYDLTHIIGNDLKIAKINLSDVVEELKDHGVKNIHVIKRGLQKVLNRMDSLLSLNKSLKEDVAEFEAEGKIDRHPENCPVKELLENAVSSLPFIPDNISIELHYADEMDEAYADPRQVGIILYNILVNALEAMPDGGEISISADNIKGFVRIKVTDTGKGISKEKQLKIFNAFYSTKKRGDGVSRGFGLWSARRNALANGGNLSAHSKPPNGATFILDLPRSEK